MPFRDDGAAAIEWVARYLERVGEYPVLALTEASVANLRGERRGELTNSA